MAVAEVGQSWGEWLSGQHGKDAKDLCHRLAKQILSSDGNFANFAKP
jgi:hypothetical protein